MEKICLKFFTPDKDTWISRSDYGINAKAYIRVEKSETDKIEVIKKVLEMYTKITYSSILNKMSYKEFLNCFEYYGFDVGTINESELDENYKIIVGNEKDFYVELEWRELYNSFILFINCICSKGTSVICEEYGIPKRKLTLKKFKSYDGHKMEACIKIKKYKTTEKNKDYFVLKDIFNQSALGCSPYVVKCYIEGNYNYEITFGKINKEYEEEYNYLIKNRMHYEMDCTLIESFSEAILNIKFNPTKVS